MPVPVSAIMKGLLVLAISLFAMSSTAVCRFVLTGVNCTVNVVVLLGLTVAVRLVTVNMAEFEPAIVIPEMMRFAVPVFVMVKVWLVLLPTATEPKLLVLTPLVRLVPRGC